MKEKRPKVSSKPKKATRTRTEWNFITYDSHRVAKEVSVAARAAAIEKKCDAMNMLGRSAKKFRVTITVEEVER